MNLCLKCKMDLGYYNPRQYCCKTYCPNSKNEFATGDSSSSDSDSEWYDDAKGPCSPKGVKEMLDALLGDAKELVVEQQNKLSLIHI